MNDLPPGLQVGTVGELFVQLRLLEAGVQTAAPLKDTGNDLIAVRGTEFRAIQVKSCLNQRPPIRRVVLPAHYHILTLVHLVSGGGRLLLDDSRIYCLSKDEVEARQRIDWQRSALTPDRIAKLFAPVRATGVRPNPK